VISKPSENEYATYFARYVSLVPEDDILAVLKGQLAEMNRILGAVPSDQERHRYAPEKWSIRGVCGHLIDGERVFGYRAFCISRGETASLPSFDENAYVAQSRYDDRPLADLMEEFAALRMTNVHFLRWLADPDWTRTGTASGKTISVRAIAYVMAGHVRHHLNILRERYAPVIES
jgi:hypothetical protein